MSKDFENFDESSFDELIEADSEEVPEEEVQEEEEAPKKKVAPPVRPPMKKPIPAVKKPVEPMVFEEEEKKLPEPVSPREPPRRKEKPQTPRYTAYKTEKRYGLIDNITGQPIADAADIETLTLTILSDILNKLDRIEASL